MTSKASGDNTILVGPTGCMYVANSSYLCTPYNVPWAHTQIGSAGSFTGGRRRRLRGDDPQGQVEGRLSEHHLRGRRRQRVGHRARVDFGRALPEPRLPDHLLRQRAVRQHRHSGLVAHAVRRHDDVLAARPDDPEAKKLFPRTSPA
jgi:hypothetical protein